MNRYRNICLPILIALMVVSCRNETGQDKVLSTVRFGDCKVADFTEMPSDMLPEIKYVVFDNDSKEFGFTSISKLLYRDGKYYIQDWRTRRIIVFGEDGNGEFALSHRGRGPKEYLQISDFDIDSEGGFWILDAQQDKVMHYRADGTFVSSAKTSVEGSNIKYLENGNILLSVPIWDKSEFSDAKVVLMDSSMTVISSYTYGKKEGDPDYVSHSYGFSSYGDKIYFVRESIDDDIAVFNEKGGFEGVVRFDFGNRMVPEDARVAVEKNRKYFDGYSFLAQSAVELADGRMLGCVMEGGKGNNFVLDRKKDILYKQSDKSRGLFMLGVSGDRALYILQPGLDDVWPGLPEDIMSAYRSDKDIIAYRVLKEK